MTVPDTVKQDIEALKKEDAGRLDDTTTPNIIYIGKARTGTATSDDTWQIKKLDETSGLDTTWADGDSLFNNVWDDRASLSYS